MTTLTSHSSISHRPMARSTAPRNGIARCVILHADDFGMNEAVNSGIIRGFTKGLLTSTSVLANAPACSSALAQWKEMQARLACEAPPSAPVRARLRDSLSRFDLGVHLNLTQGRPLTGRAFPRQLLDRDGRFPGIFALAARLAVRGRRWRGVLRDELGAQIETVLEHGLVPTHLNGHQYVELLPAIAALIPELLERYRIRVVRVAWEQGLTRTVLLTRRQPGPWALGQVKRLFAFPFLLRMNRTRALHPTDYFGTALAGRIDLATLQAFLAEARGPVVEIGLHPGCAALREPAEAGWADPLAAGRPRELDLLASHELVDLLASSQVRLGRLHELPAAGHLAEAA